MLANDRQEVHETSGEILDSVIAEEPLEMGWLGMGVVVDQHALSSCLGGGHKVWKPGTNDSASAISVSSSSFSQSMVGSYIGASPTLLTSAPQVHAVLNVPLDVEVDLEVGAWDINGARRLPLKLRT